MRVITSVAVQSGLQSEHQIKLTKNKKGPQRQGGVHLPLTISGSDTRLKSDPRAVKHRVDTNDVTSVMAVTPMRYLRQPKSTSQGWDANGWAWDRSVEAHR